VAHGQIAWPTELHVLPVRYDGVWWDWFAGEYCGDVGRQVGVFVGQVGNCICQAFNCLKNWGVGFLYPGCC